MSEPRGAARMARIFVSLLSADIVTRGMAAVAVVIVVRALAPDAYGEVAFALATAALLGVFVDVGLSVLLVRDVSADPTEAPALLGAALRLETVLGLVVFGGGATLALAGLAPGPASGPVLALAFGVLAANNLIRTFESTLAGYGRAHLVTVSHAVRGGALVAGTALASLIEPEPAGFVAAALTAELIGLATIATLCRIRCFAPRLRIPWRDVLALARRALPFAALIVFGILYLRIDLLMLGLMGTEADVGNYGLATRVVETAIAVPVFFGSAFLATVAQTGPSTRQAAAQTVSALRYVLLICVPLAFALALAADPLIDLVAGQRYDGAGEVLARLCPILALTAAYAVLGNLQIALDRMGLIVRISIAGIGLKVVLNLWAIPRYGANGAALAAVAGEGLVVAAQWYVARHDLDMGGLLRWCERLVVSAAAMIAAALLAVAVGIAWPVAGAIGVLAFAGAALITRCISVAELRLAFGSATARTP